MDFIQIARLMALFGVVLLVAAGLLYLVSRLELPLGRLPGDLIIRREDFTCVIPLATSLILSLVLTLLFNLLVRLLNK
jgi:hypothetical protein